METCLELKAALLVEGIAAGADSLAGLGIRYKEQNHGLFGWDFEDHPGTLLPDDFLLPDGTVVQFRLNSRSACRLETTDVGRVLACRGEPICPVRFLERPPFYSAATSQGVPMVRIWQIGGRTACSSATRTTAPTSPGTGSACSATSSPPRRPTIRC